MSADTFSDVTELDWLPESDHKLLPVIALDPMLLLEQK